MGIKTKTRKQSIIDNEKHITRPSGESHWSRTNKEAALRCAEESSRRMTENNPVHKNGVPEAIALTKSKLYSNNPTFHEGLIIELFNKTGVPYNFQPAIKSYVPDFLICGKVVLEIDGRGHASRKASDLIRDKLLCGLGFDVVRIDQDLLFNKRAKKPVFRPNKLIRVIEDLIPDIDVSRLLPPVTCKRRVIVRKHNPFTEIIY
jgi:very-short-patch-repair endonuclease